MARQHVAGTLLCYKATPLRCVAQHLVQLTLSCCDRFPTAAEELSYGGNTVGCPPGFQVPVPAGEGVAGGGKGATGKKGQQGEGDGEGATAVPSSLFDMGTDCVSFWVGPAVRPPETVFLVVHRSFPTTCG